MNNQIIDEFDKASLIKEIHERDIIICNYQKCGFWIEMMQLEKFRN